MGPAQLPTQRGCRSPVLRCVQKSLFWPCGLKGEGYVKGKQRVVEACLDSLLLSGYKHSWSAYPLGPTKMERVCRSPNFALTHTHTKKCVVGWYIWGVNWRVSIKISTARGCGYSLCRRRPSAAMCPLQSVIAGSETNGNNTLCTKESVNQRSTW